jgi:beta-glucosidase
MINGSDRRVIEPGWFILSVGGGQPGTPAEKEGYTRVLGTRFRLTGKEISVSE